MNDRRRGWMTNRLARVSACAALFVATAVPAAGCSSTEEPARQPLVLNEGSVLAPRGLSDVAIVAENTVSFPASDAIRKWAEKLERGNVIAGNRDTTRNYRESTNPHGFLRKVVSVDASADPIVVSTAPADLADLMTGDLKMGDAREPSIFPDAPSWQEQVQAQTLHPLDDANGDGSGGLEFSLHAGVLDMTVKNGTMRFPAKFSADYGLRKKWKIPTGIEYAWANLKIDPSVSFDVEFTGKLEKTKAPSLVRDVVDSKTFEAIEITFPAAGIPITASIGPVFECSAGANGKGTVSSHFELVLTIDGGFEYHQGGEKKIKNPTPSLNPTANVTAASGTAALSVECKLGMELKLLAFDTVGIKGSMGPALTYEAKVCANAQGKADKGVSRQLNFNVSLDATAQVPFIDEEIASFPIFNYDHPLADPVYMVGDENSCACVESSLTCE